MDIHWDLPATLAKANGFTLSLVHINHNSDDLSLHVADLQCVDLILTSGEHMIQQHQVQVVYNCMPQALQPQKTLTHAVVWPHDALPSQGLLAGLLLLCIM